MSFLNFIIKVKSKEAKEMSVGDKMKQLVEYRQLIATLELDKPVLTEISYGMVKRAIVAESMNVIVKKVKRGGKVLTWLCKY